MYTEDRETFEREFFRPPFLARMLERTGKYVDGLDDKGTFLAAALDAFWNLRNTIKGTDDVTRVWGDALKTAAGSRSKWLVHYGAALEKTRWVKGSRLGRHT